MACEQKPPTGLAVRQASDMHKSRSNGHTWTSSFSKSSRSFFFTTVAPCIGTLPRNALRFPIFRQKELKQNKICEIELDFSAYLSTHKAYEWQNVVFCTIEAASLLSTVIQAQMFGCKQSKHVSVFFHHVFYSSLGLAPSWLCEISSYLTAPVGLSNVH